MEKAVPGSGGLYSVAIDPWKCTGCLECIDVCGPHALVARHQDAALLETLQARFEFLSRTPNTPARFFDGATKPDGETKRLMLDRNNYYATTGGHGACRGCGEVTAIRLVTSANHAIHDARRKTHIREVEEPDRAAERQAADGKEHGRHDPKRRERIARTIETLEKRLYLLESGPTGNGPSSMVIANATGCSSVYASTFPFNPYNDPWVNSLFQDSPAVAKGIFEGLSAEASDEIGALRIARLDLDDEYDPQVHDRFFKLFGWNQFTPEELSLLPTVISMGGDGATYDIGFGALSRLLEHLDADQGGGAQQRRVLEHRRAGIDRQPDRPGLRSRPVRRRASAASRKIARNWASSPRSTRTCSWSRPAPRCRGTS